jgi:hypothetical protein
MAFLHGSFSSLSERHTFVSGEKQEMLRGRMGDKDGFGTGIKEKSNRLQHEPIWI